ncbi:MAG TPA: RIP metalloprotease RseP, partial [Stellaceae bacterium]|nr:RIP metalloprotease RseP [Stellaceae bacterium]
ANAGIKPGDEFVSVDGHSVHTFQDLVDAVRANSGDVMQFVLQRDGKDVTVTATPTVVEETDAAGNQTKRRLLGVSPRPVYIRQGPIDAVTVAAQSTWDMTVRTLHGIGQIIVGTRSTREVGGLVSIGKILDDAAAGGATLFFVTTAGWSISLGLINLFPIPVLDGGHLLFYAAEAVLGRPLGRRTQELGFKIGLALVLMLMVFANGNDLVRLVIPILKHLFT